MAAHPPLQARKTAKTPKAPKLPTVQIYSSFKEHKKAEIVDSARSPLSISMQYVTRKGSFAPLDASYGKLRFPRGGRQMPDLG